MDFVRIMQMENLRKTTAPATSRKTNPSSELPLHQAASYQPGAAERNHVETAAARFGLARLQTAQPWHPVL
jgi:hypothetical protein